MGRAGGLWASSAHPITIIFSLCERSAYSGRHWPIQPIGRLIHARIDDPLSLYERLQQDPLDAPSMPPLLGKLAAKLSQNEESRQKRRRERERLADKAHYENLLNHVFPATDS